MEGILDLIIKYQLTINPVFGDIDVDEDHILEGEGPLEYWSVFNGLTGGHWHEHENLIKAIERAIGEA